MTAQARSQQDRRPRALGETGTRGELNYLDADTRSSLYRNGAVLMRRNLDGSDSKPEGMRRDTRLQPIADARALKGEARMTLAANGFELVDRPLADPALDFLNHERVVRGYYPECERLVSEWTGARAFAFDHNVRSAGGKKSGKRIAGGQEVQGPAHAVHGDYTLTSAPQRLRDLTKPPGGNDTLRPFLGADKSLISAGDAERVLGAEGRFAIINVWRNIAPEPVATHPMAFCDGRTVAPEDLVVFEIHYADRIGENYFAKHTDTHRWYTYPGVTRDEAILIKQWDAGGTLARTQGKAGDGTDPLAPCTFSFHSAFKDPGTPPDAPDRWSIEVRCLVLYD